MPHTPTKPRLTSLKPRLSAMAPRLGPPPGDVVAFDRYRNATLPWRQWYRTNRWRKLRWSVLVEQCFTCQMCKRMILEKGKAVADHIRPHHGDARLFWDRANIQCLCSACHDSAKKIEEGRGAIKLRDGARK